MRGASARWVRTTPRRAVSHSPCHTRRPPALAPAAPSLLFSLSSPYCVVPSPDVLPAGNLLRGNHCIERALCDSDDGTAGRTALPPPSPPPPPAPPPPPLPPAPSTGPQCSGGRVWRECGRSCTPTCDDPMPFCTFICVQRCECPMGARHAVYRTAPHCAPAHTRPCCHDSPSCVHPVPPPTQRLAVVSHVHPPQRYHISALLRSHRVRRLGARGL